MKRKTPLIILAVLLALALALIAAGVAEHVIYLPIVAGGGAVYP